MYDLYPTRNNRYGTGTGQCIIILVNSSFFTTFRGIHYLCEINVKQTFQCEDALKLLLNILTIEGHKCWTYYSGPEDFNNLMVKFCREFSLLQDEHKFELCDVIRTILRSFPKSNFDEESWLPMLQRGLHDILFSKITKRQRDPAMQLVAAVIEVSGMAGQE